MRLAPHMDPMFVPTPADYPRDDAWRGPGAPILDPPQADWVSDDARLKIALKGRQAGFSFAEMLAQVLECAERPRTTWVNLSRGERQSRELIEKAARHVEAAQVAVDAVNGQVIEETEVYCDSIAKSVKQLSITFANGSKIIGLPANADTARGFSGNVFLDEFAFHQDARAIKAAVIPIISRGYRCRIVSTPNGKSGAFYEMWSDRESGYSRHRVDIYELAARNVHYRPDVAALRRAMADDELFAQEYECAFLDEGSAFIPLDLISACESEAATLDEPLDRIAGDLFGGCDIGRRRDQTVIWIAAKIPGGPALVTKRIDVLKNTPFAAQLAALEPIAARCGRFAIDETGLGMMLAEELERKLGARVMPVTFTLAAKEDLAVRMKRRMEDRGFLIPSANFVRSSFHSIKRTASGDHFRFDAARTEETGHADAWWAACLANFAATQPAIEIAYRPCATPPLTGYFRGQRPEPRRPTDDDHAAPRRRLAGF